MSQLFVLAGCVYFALFGAAVYFTRATRRRVLGALAGGAVVAVGGVGVEIWCQSRGFWRYPGVNTGYGPPLMYPVVLLMFAMLALIGWRVTRRFGRRGQLIFLIVLMIVGTLRDYRVAAALPQMFTMGAGVTPVIVDALCWSGLTVVAQAVMRLLAGPAESDALRPVRRTDGQSS